MLSIPPTGLLILVVGALVIWGLRVERQRQRRRAEELTRLAASLGFTFELYKPLDFPDMQRLSPPNCQIRSIRNVLRGFRGDIEVLSFDCIQHYRNNRIISDPKTTLACFRMHGKKLPWFSVTPDTTQNWLPTRALIFGAGVVSLDPNLEFSKNFVARTHDHNPEAVRELFTPELQRSIVSLDARRDWFVWGDGEWVCPRIPSGVGPLLPDEYPAFIQRAAALAEAFFGASHYTGKR